jgi:hypothetical protein
LKKKNKKKQVKKKVKQIETKSKKQVFWQRKTVERDWFFPLFQQISHNVKYPTVSRSVQTDRGLFRFLFRWQDEDTCGIEVFQKLVFNG